MCKGPQVCPWEEVVVMEQRSVNISSHSEARVLDDLSMWVLTLMASSKEKDSGMNLGKYWKINR